MTLFSVVQNNLDRKRGLTDKIYNFATGGLRAINMGTLDQKNKPKVQMSVRGGKDGEHQLKTGSLLGPGP